MARGNRTVYEPGATHTEVWLTFYPHQDGDGFSGQVTGQQNQFGHILSVNTSNQMGAVKGSFQIGVKKISDQDSWLRMWRNPEGIWVHIQWVLDGQIIDGMLGQIDTIQESTRRVGQGAMMEDYTIHGSSHGRVFEHTTPYMSVYGVEDPTALPYAPLQNRLHFAAGDATPGEYVSGLIEAWIGNYDNRDFPTIGLPPGMSGNSFHDILYKDIVCKVPSVDGFLTDISLFDPNQQGAGNLWSVMSEHANLLMNEMYTDLTPIPGDDPLSLIDLAPSIVLRRKPYRTLNDRQKWDALPTHTLLPEDINSRQVARGGPAQRFNFWQMDFSGIQDLNLHSVLRNITPNSDGLSGRPGGYPIWDLQGIHKYGFRLWKQATNFLPIGVISDGNLPRQASNWLRRCHDWHAPAIYELSGNLTTSRLRPEIRIGQKIKEHHQDGLIEYYIESVNNSWTYGSAGRTQVTVSRGEYEGENHLQRVYELLEQAEVAATRSISSVTIGEEAFGGEGVIGERTDLTDFIESEGQSREVVRESSGDPIPREGSISWQELIQRTDDPLSPSEMDASRAYRGEPEQTIEAPTNEGQTASTESFGREALENHEPILIEEGTNSDPLWGVDDSGPTDADLALEADRARRGP